MKTLIAVPCMDMVHTVFMSSLLTLRPVGQVSYGFACSSLIYDARNNLAKQAVEEGFDRILWFDSDMTFGPDFMEKLAADMDAGKEMVSGIYIKRKEPYQPVIFSSVKYVIDDGKISTKATFYDKYPKDSVFEIAGCGFGGVMMTTDLIKRITAKYGLPFSPILGFGEDLSFCVRAGELGEKMWCDSSAKMGHMAMVPITEETYLGGR